MAQILYEDGKKIGEIDEWKVIADVPATKNILGKIVTLPAAKDQCTFTSPKPIHRKAKLIMIENGKKQYDLEVKSVKGSTFVTASIVSVKSC